jgi:hypothetical protein
MTVLKEEECLEEAETRMIRKQSASLAHDDDDDGRHESTARLGSGDGGREVIALASATSRRGFCFYAAISIK